MQGLVQGPKRSDELADSRVLRIGLLLLDDRESFSRSLSSRKRGITEERD